MTYKIIVELEDGTKFVDCSGIPAEQLDDMLEMARDAHDQVKDVYSEIEKKSDLEKLFFDDNPEYESDF